MQTFLEETVAQIREQYTVDEHLVLVVPSKRAGLFLLQLFAKTAPKPGFAPAIYTIEEFVSVLSGIRYATNTQLIFELFEVYRGLRGKEAESFHEFSKWGGTLLQDFNEIDRYLISQEKIFSYLSAIQETDHWYLRPDKTPMIRAYIEFWNSLEPLYNAFSEHLLNMNLGYQGLVYRKASEAVEQYALDSGKTHHVFIGFNALNTAEQVIMKTLLSHDKADIFWDIDPVFIQDKVHDAGYFIRSYFKKWKSLSAKHLKDSVESYESHKEIRIIGVPKSVSQAKYVGSLLNRLASENTSFQKSAAVVLGDENLLNPLLNSIPPSISKVNITMGLPLSQSPAGSLFNEFIALYVNWKGQGWYHRDLLSLLSHPYIKRLFKKPDETLDRLGSMVRDQNWVYIRPSHLKEVKSGDEQIFSLLFSEGFATPSKLLKASSDLIKALIDRFKLDGDAIGLQYLTKMESVFNETEAYVNKYEFIADLRSFQSLFRELMTRETIDFYGQPLEGIQVMGMLESRNLDFETVIITSVNEGILPSGKTHSSFIPFDVKKEFRMPTYKEKDAVYTYHFYRLLQRAKNIYLLYNTEPDVLEGGEPSRFISQLLTEKRKAGNIRHIIASPSLTLPEPVQESIGKDHSVLETLKERASIGFSPSALATYIRDPILFYKKYVLGIKEPEEVEENIAANTFGTILHASLEHLYTPFVGSVIDPEKLNLLIPQIPQITRNAFRDHYPNVSLESGKNLIAYQVIQKYLENYLKMAIEESKKHRIEILAVEQNVQISLDIPGLPFPVYLKGIIDRVDKKDGMLRILDYKTGNTKKSEVEIGEWGEIITDPDKTKAFQMMSYAYMFHSLNSSESFKAGIVPFRSLEKEVFLFGYPGTVGNGTSRKENVINTQALDAFKEQLHQLLYSLFDLQIPFEAKVE
ncbi:PD-(D/E)XK nuclease family protein [Muriicola sp.]|uniref:PD-(D/E)XK nuclease family protein n=1 Tax=Muriicola sp. TaxID=2020856 RepID=UPI003565FA5D